MCREMKPPLQHNPWGYKRLGMGVGPPEPSPSSTLSLPSCSTGQMPTAQARLLNKIRRAPMGGGLKGTSPLLSSRRSPGQSRFLWFYKYRRFQFSCPQASETHELMGVKTEHSG